MEKLICSVANLNKKMKTLGNGQSVVILNCKHAKKDWDFWPYQDHQTFIFVTEEDTDPVSLVSEEYKVLQWFRVKLEIIDSSV